MTRFQRHRKTTIQIHRYHVVGWWKASNFSHKCGIVPLRCPVPRFYLKSIAHSSRLLGPTASKAGLGFWHDLSYSTEADCIRKGRQKPISKKGSSMTAGVSTCIGVQHKQCPPIYLTHESLLHTNPYSSLPNLCALIFVCKMVLWYHVGLAHGAQGSKLHHHDNWSICFS